MPGGLDPFPRRFGGIRGRPLEVITNSLNAQMGTAYDTGSGSTVWAQSHAIARAIAAAWETNDRFRRQFDPYRVTDFLPRWETIFGITPVLGATPSQRRAAIATRWSAIGKAPWVGNVNARLQALLPNTFVKLVRTPAFRATSSAYANVIPGSGGQPAGGAVVPTVGGAWFSSVHYDAIQVQQPAWMPDAQFYQEVGQVFSDPMRKFFPAWVTYGWFRDGSIAPGFVLDDTHNLDNERLLDVISGAVTVGGAAFTQRIFPQYFSQNSSAPPPTYANYYGFNVSSSTVTITITRSSGSGLAAYVMGPGTASTGNPTVAATTSAGASLTLHTPVLNGSYVLEINSNATDTLGTSPMTITVSIASP